MTIGARLILAAGTMFELVKELKDGAEALKRQSSNSISLSAGTELFIEFVTLFPHDASVRANRCSHFESRVLITASFQSFLELKSELIRQGHNYVTEALSYRQKIADLAFDFIKDGSIVLLCLSAMTFSSSSCVLCLLDPNTFILKGGDADTFVGAQTETHIWCAWALSTVALTTNMCLQCLSQRPGRAVLVSRQLKSSLRRGYRAPSSLTRRWHIR